MKKMINSTNKTGSRKLLVPIPKINSNSYGGKWIAAGIMIGGVLPAAVWFVFHLFLWWLCIIGGAILTSFLVLFIIEMHQDFGKTPHYERYLKETILFSPMKNANKLTVLPVRKLMDIMTITS